jgi:hypothetical protein
VARKPTDTVQLKLRFSEALRRRLERKAKRQERSLNAEIIGRLDESFQKEREAESIADVLHAAAGGATGDLLRAVATAIWLIERRTGKKWNEDPETLNQARFTVDLIMDLIPLNAQQAVQDMDIETARKIDAIYRKWRARYVDTPIGPLSAAIQTLLAMGMGPSAEEINAEAAKRRLEGIGSKEKGEGQ